MFNALNECSIAYCVPYSENPELLASVLQQVNHPCLEITCQPDGIRKYFHEDKEERQCLVFNLKRNGKIFAVPFGLSIVDTEKIRKEHGKIPQSVYNHLVYYLLCSLKIDSAIPEYFDDFADEYYSDAKLSDYNWIKGIHDSMMKQKRDTMRMFTPEEIESFPS